MALAASPSVRLDSADVILLRELFRWGEDNYPHGPLRIPLREMAARTGLHENTVRARLQEMRDSGVLDGAVLEPRADLVGLVRWGYGFEVPRMRDDLVLAALAGFPFYSSIVLCDRFLLVHGWSRTDAEVAPAVEATRRALGATSARQAYRSSEFPVPPAQPLGSLDRRIILALRRAPGRSLAAVARGLKISGRTMERRAKSLVQRGAASMMPLLRPSRIEGLFAEYAVWEGDERTAGSLARSFPDRILGPLPGGRTCHVGVLLPSLAEAERRRVAAEGAPGVPALEVYLVRDVAYPKGFDGWLEAAILGERIPAGDGERSLAPSR